MKRSYAKFVERLEAVGRREKIEARAKKLHVSLRDLYEGGRAPSIVAARRAIYTWLMNDGMGHIMSLNEVARLFDRAPSGVWKMCAGIGVRK